MTNEEISALTDRKINEMVSAEIGGISGEKYESGQVGAFIYYTLDCGSKLAVEVKNYCNDPSVMMPIVIKEKINLISSTGDLWGASWNDGGGKWSIDDYKRHHKNPLRAAAIVYLKMKGVL